VKTIGDAVMLRCEQAAAAVELGLRIAEEVRRHEHFPVVRIGMHTGPATERDGDWFGATVNIAARVAGIAGGGEVLVSGTTREAAGALKRVEFRRHGLRRLKNVGEAVDVYGAACLDEKADVSPIDPVCRMAVDPEQAVGSLTFDGRKYFFCSFECSRAFSENPEKFATPG
jgi:adenylate cyclase